MLYALSDNHAAPVTSDLEAKIRDLEAAVVSARSISTAIGIVMTQYELDQERAFAYLRRLSQHQNVKLRVIADAIVAHADLRARGTVVEAAVHVAVPPVSAAGRVSREVHRIG